MPEVVAVRRLFLDPERSLNATTVVVVVGDEVVIVTVFEKCLRLC